MGITTLYNEKTLLERIAVGDQSAFTELYHHYAPEVFNTAMVYLKDELDATELVQEVFLKIWEKRDKLAQVDSFINYLFILARNHIYDGFRKKAAEQSALSHFFRNAPNTAVDDTDHPVQDRQYEKLVQSAIEQLSPARKKVYLARQQGKSFQTIATEIGISEATAKKQMTQARQFVQEYILQYLHVYGILLLMHR